MKKILFAASEAVPFIKTGGLADVVGTLPKYFPKNRYDVRLILPKYLCMDPAFLQGFERILECQVNVGWRLQYCGILKKKMDGITCYLVDNEFYFGGPSPYDTIALDAEKFVFFSRAVLTVLKELDYCPDVIHCHDWQTGLLPVFLREEFAWDPFYAGIRTVFTIHNLRFQGCWYVDAMKDITGLPDHMFSYDRLESYGKANMLKGGVVYADEITTVSESYAEEICTRDGGEGLDGALSYRKDHLHGILNGIDVNVFDPKKDPAITKQYARSFPAYKAANKAALQAEMGLNQDPDCILIGMVSRMTDQKGFDLLLYRKDEIMQDERVQLLVLGSGESRYEDQMRAFAAQYPGRVTAWIGYNEELSHRIYAGCDAFLMPSLFEPCGLSQMISMRYGTVPLVRLTGGLKDTVRPYNETDTEGVGFGFEHFNAHEMHDMIRYATYIYAERREEWDAIAKRCMKQDFSWKRSAKAYAALYDRLIG